MTTFVRFVLAAAVSLGLAGGPALAANLGGGGSTSSKPKNPSYEQAQKLVSAGDYAAAVPLLQKAVAVDPRNANAFNVLGYSHRRLGDAQAAMTYYRKALALDPKHRGANEYLGELYLEMGQLDKAKERLDVLNGACFFGCDEYRDLKAAIKAYEQKAGS